MRRTPKLATPVVAALLLLLSGTLGAQKSSAPGLARIDELVTEAMAARLTPGAVVVIGSGDQTVYEKSFGFRATVPADEPMTLDTVFDLASLTKVVGTTTAVMTLIEDGRIRLNGTVASYIPGFERYGKGGITIRHLLTHVSGLRPDVDLHPWTGHDAAIELAKDEVPTSAPGESFVYSDINFFLLGDIVSRVTGQSLDAYLRARVFVPLGMTDTGFLPAEDAAAADCADRALQHDGCDAVQAAGRAAPARHRPRSHRAAHGRYRRARGIVQHGARSEIVRAHAARQGPARRHARALRGERDGDDVAANAGWHAERPRIRLGHRYVVLEQSRRSVSSRHLVRPHRLHRHQLVDRSDVELVRDLPVEPIAS